MKKSSLSMKKISDAYTNSTAMPLRKVRRLRRGDVIHAFFIDTEETSAFLITEDVSKYDSRLSLRVMPLNDLKDKRRTSVRGYDIRTINTDHYQYFGRYVFDAATGELSLKQDTL